MARHAFEMNDEQGGSRECGDGESPLNPRPAPVIFPNSCRNFKIPKLFSRTLHWVGRHIHVPMHSEFTQPRTVAIYGEAKRKFCSLDGNVDCPDPFARARSTDGLNSLALFFVHQSQFLLLLAPFRHRSRGSTKETHKLQVRRLVIKLAPR